MNQNCLRDKKRREFRDNVGKIDFERHDPQRDPNAALYEASRCLATGSCEACDVCRFLCPDLAITRDSVTGEIHIDLNYCKGCGICAALCPKGAIRMVVEEDV